MNSDELPEPIKTLVGRCEINETAFDNSDMSLALTFGEMLWRRLGKMADYYDRRAAVFAPGDIWAKTMTDVAKDMRFVLSDCQRDILTKGTK